MIGVILAAGDGKRLKSSSNAECCKPLLKISNKKLIEFSLDNLVRLHVSEAYIVVGKEGNQIKEAMGNTYKQIKLHYVYQAEQKGLINAFVLALEAIPDIKNVVFQLADEIFIDLHADLIKTTLDAKKYDFYCGITVEEDFEQIKKNYSVETTEDFVIAKCTEKPKLQINNLKGTGLCVFSRRTLNMLLKKYDKDTNSPCELCDYINWLIDEKCTGLALRVAEKEFNINTCSDLEEAAAYLQQQ